MIIEQTKLPDVWLIKPVRHGDARGYFSETFRADKLRTATGLPLEFVQDNESRSTYGVLRGLHFQKPPYAQSKLVRVTEGKVLDVAVDIRHGSPTFGQAVAVELSAENQLQLFIPRGFAHGFVVLSEFATFCYKVDNYYSPQHDAGLDFADPMLAIDWQLPVSALLLSQKDQQQPSLLQIDSGFSYGEPYYD